MIISKTILSDTWYGKEINYPVVNFNDYLSNNYTPMVRKLISKFGILRGYMLYKAGRSFDTTITNLSHKGVLICIILKALFGKDQNQLIILEFILNKPQNKFYNILWPFWIKTVFAPAFNKAVHKAQVLTLNERHNYANILHTSIDKFSFIPWPLRGKNASTNKPDYTPPAVKAIQPYVMVSGRANVDWKTIFMAFDKSEWRLLVVCSSNHLPKVTKLNKNGRAIIFNDIASEQHEIYVKGATVYALCLEESNASVGQVRLMNTIDAGIPVVATDVQGLKGYAAHNVNAVLVPANDASQLKKEIDTLFFDAQKRKKLVETARLYQASNTFENYLVEILKFIKIS